MTTATPPAVPGGVGASPPPQPAAGGGTPGTAAGTDPFDDDGFDAARRETIALVEAAGKEAPPRRARLRVVLESAVDFFRAALRHAVSGEVPADPAMARALAARPVDPEAADAGLRVTLDALSSVDRNANLTVLVDAWTAVLEEPRLEVAGRG